MWPNSITTAKITTLIRATTKQSLGSLIERNSTRFPIAVKRPRQWHPVTTKSNRPACHSPSHSRGSSEELGVECRRSHVRIADRTLSAILRHAGNDRPEAGSRCRGQARGAGLTGDPGYLPRLAHVTYGAIANVDLRLGPPIALPRQAGRLLCADAGPVSIRPDRFRVGPHARPPIRRMVQRRMSPRRTDRKGRARVRAARPSLCMHRVGRQRDGARSHPLRPGTSCPHRSIPRSSTRLG
jgi:hypothetical protein